MSGPGPWDESAQNQEKTLEIGPQCRPSGSLTPIIMPNMPQADERVGNPRVLAGVQLPHIGQACHQYPSPELPSSLFNSETMGSGFKLVPWQCAPQLVWGHVRANSNAIEARLQISYGRSKAFWHLDCYPSRRTRRFCKRTRCFCRAAISVLSLGAD